MAKESKGYGIEKFVEEVEELELLNKQILVEVTNHGISINGVLEIFNGGYLFE